MDEDVLREVGVTDFDPYAAVKGTKDFMPDFFLDDFLGKEFLVLRKENGRKMFCDFNTWLNTWKF